MSVDSLNSNKVQDNAYSIQLPDGDALIAEQEQDSSACQGLGGLAQMQLPNLFKSQMQMLSSVAPFNSQDCITLLVADPATYSPPVPPDVDAAAIEAPWNAKSKAFATVRKVLQRQLSGHLGGKFTQHMVDHFLVLLRISPKDKLTAERTHDASLNRWRKYKRSASFDSRKVGLFFSILSIIGTLILICLTLRVRQIGESALVPS